MASGIDSVWSFGRHTSGDDKPKRGTASDGGTEICGSEQQNRELRHASEMMMRVVSFIGAELDIQHR